MNRPPPPPPPLPPDHHELNIGYDANQPPEPVLYGAVTLFMHCGRPYAALQKSTGFPAKDPNNNYTTEDGDYEYYGPYLSCVAAALVYDINSLIRGFYHQPGNFVPLARCVLAEIESLPFGAELEPPLKIVYATTSLDSGATHIRHASQGRRIDGFQTYNWTETKTLLREWDIDIEGLREKHGPALLGFHNRIIAEAISPEKLWPQGVWTKFTSHSISDAPPNFEELPEVAGMSPCIRVLVGEKAINHHAGAGPSVPAAVVEFKTEYAAMISETVEAELGNQVQQRTEIPGHLCLAKTLVFALGRYVRNLRPDLKPFLFGRYAGHMVDALALTMNVDNRNAFQLPLAESIPVEIWSRSSQEYADGLMGTANKAAFRAAFADVVHGYNGRHWPFDFWKPFLRHAVFQGQPPGQEQAYYAQYSTFRHSIGVPQAGEEESEGKLLEGDEPYGGTDAAIGEEEEGEDVVFGRKEGFMTNIPGAVRYAFDWRCSEGHGNREQDEEEFVIMSGGDCPCRIHEEVKQVFPFATASARVRTHPCVEPPRYVSKACKENNAYAVRPSPQPNSDPESFDPRHGQQYI